jgi:16S rRNA G966 N2-methylase RsmD
MDLMDVPEAQGRRASCSNTHWFAFAGVLGQNERAMSEKNQLCFRDNLLVLPRYAGNESVDLAYLDPPFTSNALFGEHDGAEAEAQTPCAFGDTTRMVYPPYCVSQG